MSNLINIAFSPVGMTAVLLVACVWLYRRSPGPGRRALLILGLAYTALSIYGFSYGISRVLVMGYRPLGAGVADSPSTAIVVLGAGEGAVYGWEGDVLGASNSAGLARLVEAIRVHRLYPKAWIIASGGTARHQPGPFTSASRISELLQQRGVPAAQIRIEDTSSNTWDEAVTVATMLGPLKVDRVILVTSDIHMRRAMGAFRAAGIDAVPAIARDPHLSAGWSSWLLPTSDGLDLAGQAVHEAIGILYYRVRGRWR